MFYLTFSKRQAVIVAFRQFFQRRGRAILGRRLRSRAAGFFLAAAKIHVLRDDLGASALIPVVVRPWPDLQPSGDDCQLSLGKILADKLRRAAPGNDVDKVRFPFAAVLAGIIPVDGQREGRNRSPVCSVPKLRVSRQAALNCYYV